MLQVSLLASIVVVVVMSLLAASGAQAAQVATPITTPAGPAFPIETLFTTTLPASAVPTTSSGALLIWYVTIATGTQVTTPRELVACCPGPKIEHVVAGELRLRVAGPLQVTRAASAGTPSPVEEIAPETEVVLRAGDTAVYDLALSVTYSNLGTDVVRLVSGGLFAGVPPVPPAGYTIDSFAGRLLFRPKERSPASPLAPRPLAATLQRTTLAPEAIFPAPPSEAVQVVMSGPELGSLGVWGDGPAQNLGQESVEIYALILRLAEPKSGTPVL